MVARKSKTSLYGPEQAMPSIKLGTAVSSNHIACCPTPESDLAISAGSSKGCSHAGHHRGNAVGRASADSVIGHHGFGNVIS